ncbi:MAG TPA: hypothetical protein VLH09_07515 [Bryobacteraceae bacterium]|nr:hypothetical protein [Bryobacteraceae bacterium]
MQPGSEHATEETLELYSLGSLPDGDTELLEEHLLICPQCQEKLAETDIYVRHMRAVAAKLRDEDLRREPAGRNWRKMSGFWWPAIAVCCLAGLVWVVASRNTVPRVQAPPVAVVLHAVRGANEAVSASAPEGRPLRIEADLTGLADGGRFEMELVDAGGLPAQRSAVTAQGGRAVLLLSSGLGQGTYWVRLYAAGPPSELLREYALRVQ